MKKFLTLLFCLCLGLTSFAQDDCDCDWDGNFDEYVCAADSLGNIYPVPNECIAACFELTIVDEDCDFDTDWEDDCACDESDLEGEGICIEVVYDGEAYADWVPSECYAECWGYTDYTVVDCDFGDWEDDSDWETDCDCEWDGDEDFVCAVDEEGNLIPVPNACFAECWGLSITDEDCSDWDTGWEYDCACEESDWEGEGICIEVIYEGEAYTDWVPSECYAECWGYTDYTVVECDFGDHGEDPDCPPFEDCECEESDWETEGICIEVIYEGETYTEWVPSECFAACFGFEDYTIVDCDFGDDWGTECECEEEDWEGEGICIEVNYDGEVYTEWVPSECFAACFGFDEYTVVDCDFGDWEDDSEWGSDCECEDEDWNGDGICIEVNYDGEVYTEWVPSECFAACFGFDEYTVVDCDFGDWEDDSEWEADPCIIALEGEEIGTLQSFLLLLAENCDIELPACVLDAPTFDNDEDFLNYLLENCPDDMGMIMGSEDGNPSLFTQYQGLTDGTNETATSTFEPINGLNMNLVSNPVSERVILNVTADNDMNIVVNMLDLNGQVIQASSRSIAKGQSTIDMPTTELTSGMYIMNINSAQGSSAVKFVVKH